MVRSSIALFLAGAGLATTLTGCSTAQPEGGDQVRPSQAPPAQAAPQKGDESGEGGEGGEG